MVCEYTSFRDFDGGRFFMSQISPKGKREKKSFFLFFQRCANRGTHGIFRGHTRIPAEGFQLVNR